MKKMLGVMLLLLPLAALADTGSVVGEGNTAPVTLPRGTANLQLYGSDFGACTIKLQVMQAGGADGTDVPGAVFVGETTYPVGPGHEGSAVRLEVSDCSTTPEFTWEIEADQ